MKATNLLLGLLAMSSMSGTNQRGVNISPGKIEPDDMPKFINGKKRFTTKSNEYKKHIKGL